MKSDMRYAPAVLIKATGEGSSNFQNTAHNLANLLKPILAVMPSTLPVLLSDQTWENNSLTLRTLLSCQNSDWACLLSKHSAYQIAVFYFLNFQNSPSLLRYLRVCRLFHFIFRIVFLVPYGPPIKVLPSLTIVPAVYSEGCVIAVVTTEIAIAVTGSLVIVTCKLQVVNCKCECQG